MSMNKNNPSPNRGAKIAATVLAFAALGTVGIVTALSLGGRAPVQAAMEDTTPTALVGKPAPDFTLPDQDDKPVTLSTLKGKWVVLAFYPADMTSGCTIQNQSYSKHIGEFAPKNATVYTISTQNTASKREFCSKAQLQHRLLSDTGGKVAKQYDALPENGTFANRWTYYVAPDGKIAYVDTKIKVGTAAEDSLALLTKLEKEYK